MLTRIQAVELAVAAAITTFLLWQYDHRPATSAGADGPAVEATEAPIIRGEERQPVAAPNGVQVYAPAVKQKSRLPTEVKDNPDTHVATASSVRADEHPQQVTTVVDTKTGEVTNYVQEQPLPWLALDLHGEAAGYYDPFNKAGRVEVRQNVLQIKAVHLQGLLSAEQSNAGTHHTFAGIGLAYRW